MRPIEAKVYTVLESGGFGKHYVLDVAADKGYRVPYYEKLVDLVADIGYHNHRFTLLFRGQPRDCRQPWGKQKTMISSLFPAFWRRGPKGRRRGWTNLEKWSRELCALETLSRAERRQLRGIPERPWAILQHYSSVTRCETPLLDVTSDLRVAATFATRDYSPDGQRKQASDHGILYIFGMPAISQGTTISVDDSLIVLRLQSVCPANARRPHFQNGYLVGTYPTNNRSWKKHKNLALRLLGKLRLPVDDRFWDVDKPLCAKAVYPEKDDLRDQLARIRSEVAKNT